MSDISITAANVAKTTTNSVEYGTAGGTITAGMAVYLDEADSRYKAARANSAATAICSGIALHGASAGQPLAVQTGGIITIGGTAVVGEQYVVSAAAAGGIAPLSDLSTGNYVVPLGWGKTATTIQLDRTVLAVQKP